MHLGFSQKTSKTQLDRRHHFHNGLWFNTLLQFGKLAAHCKDRATTMKRNRILMDLLTVSLLCPNSTPNLMESFNFPRSLTVAWVCSVELTAFWRHRKAWEHGYLCCNTNIWHQITSPYQIFPRCGQLLHNDFCGVVNTTATQRNC